MKRSPAVELELQVESLTEQAHHLLYQAEQLVLAAEKAGVDANDVAMSLLAFEHDFEHLTWDKGETSQ